jgi:predicted permease
MDFQALFSTFVNNLLPILLVGATGFLLGKTLHIDSRSLGRVVFYVFSPILVFNLLLHTELSSSQITGMVAFVFALYAIVGVLAFLSGRLMGLERPILMAVVLTAALGNTGNYGLPLVSFAFGDHALAYATLFFVTSTVLFNTVGVMIASLGHMDIKTAAAGVFKVPGVYAVLVAAAMNRFDVVLPTPLARTVDLAAGGSIPLMIVLLGLELARVEWSHSVKPIALSVSLRLVAAPAIGLLLAGLFGFQGPARQASVSESGVPSAVTTLVLATEYGLDTSLVTAMVFIGTILSPLTLTPLLVFLGK